MKLVRYGAPGRERPGAWLETPGAAPRILDVRGMASDIQDYDAAFFAQGGLARLPGLLAEDHPRTIPAAGVRLGPPVAPPPAIYCVGKNYAAHAAEFGGGLPEQPIFFAKAATAVVGPTDPVRLPPGPARVDGEVELAVVLGRTVRGLRPAEALEALAGFLILNDVTDRLAQQADGQWFRAKSADTFCPLGPWLVTPDEIPDWRALRLRLWSKDQLLQDAPAADMVFALPELLAALSARLTLPAGTILATGTPSGIGSARQPPVLLEPGDTLRATITGLGEQANPVTGPAAGRA
ncbi:MAG: fumarylacetoacetate hydrolase family protein [Candidatus Marinimicrobia bacterium]|nr:fumarylacetoacetate hydrolase family protein [Candidatus Neomarinimicrobiota bacterium]